jgi:hypothetical protein
MAGSRGWELQNWRKKVQEVESIRTIGWEDEKKGIKKVGMLRTMAGSEWSAETEDGRMGGSGGRGAEGSEGRSEDQEKETMTGSGLREEEKFLTVGGSGGLYVQEIWSIRCEIPQNGRLTV